MPGNLDDYLIPLLPAMAPPLFSPAAVRSIRALACKLPPVSIAGFECRLGGKTAPVDLSIGILRQDGRRAILANTHPRFTPDPCWQAQPLWSRLSRFCELWADPASDLNNCVESLWLEFDLDPEHEALPVPAPFLYTAPPVAYVPHEVARRFEYLLSQALPVLCHPPLPSAIMDQIRICRRLLPPGAVCRALGLWSSRPDGGVRLGIGRISPATIPSYLKSIGWKGDLAQVAALISLAAEMGLTVDPGLDITTEVSSRIGLRFRWSSAERYAEDWCQPLLTEFVKRGMCTAEERSALLAWRGTEWLESGQDPWITELEGLALFAGGRVRTGLKRVLSSFKVSVAADGTVETKAYFGYMHRIVRAG